MGHRIFLAGAAGAIGRRLAPLLRAAGHEVWGTTRAPEKAATLRDLGVEPVLVDVYDAAALARAVAEARPEIVIHQLTDLPKNLDPALMAEAVGRNARVRDVGTRNLVAAALKAGARRLVAQSIAWVYAPAPGPRRESDPLDTGAEAARGVTIGGVLSLEKQALGAAPLEGIVLRYGRFYGPGTGLDAPPAPPAVHVDAAAHAALLAVERGAAGVYNVAEPCDALVTDKACAELGWSPDFRLKAQPAAGA